MEYLIRSWTLKVISSLWSFRIFVIFYSWTYATNSINLACFHIWNVVQQDMLCSDCFLQLLLPVIMSCKRFWKYILQAFMTHWKVANMNFIFYPDSLIFGQNYTIDSRFHSGFIPRQGMLHSCATFEQRKWSTATGPDISK